ncbi:MAG: pyruvate kinase alpha/beta domain-containing protein [Nitrospirota bacterium]
MERKVTYFEKPGRENTAACLEISRRAVQEYGYAHIVVASTSGETGIMFAEAFREKGVGIVVVTHSAGFKSPNTIEISDDARRRIESLGARVFTGSMLTHSIETAFSAKFSGLYPTHIVANTLRRFGEGAKVCCEIVMMAADAGLVPEGEEVLAVAGTAWGADTVMLVRSAASKRFLELRVLEILAKPRG